MVLMSDISEHSIFIPVNNRVKPTMRNVELLSPAKNLECGIEAIKHGADAVYIGGPNFGARVAASNSIEDIASLCQFAHIFGARVYVTFNTILYDNELKEAEKTIWDLYEAGVDALIVQDMALLEMNLPPIALHASTQMNNRSVEKVRLLEACGFSQIVLARELPLSEIRQISEAVETPLEAFIHGALCVSYSGECYASQHCFNRSANRGECAQFCRMSFDLLNADGTVLAKNKHLLSLRDMNRTTSVEDMMLAGISSFKIEGRLKEVDYVKNVTAHYRRIIDEIIAKHPGQFKRSSYGTSSITFEPNVCKSFNRKFTNYFIDGNRTKDLQNIDSPKSMGEKIGTIAAIDKRRQCFKINLLPGVAINAGDGLCFFDANNQLRGCRIEKANGAMACVENISFLQNGMTLYRNFDNNFSKTLSKTTAQRIMEADAVFTETPNGFKLEMTAKNQCRASVETTHEHEKANKPQKENIRRQLEKMGGTPFRLRQLAINIEEDYFIPSSILANMRRSCVDLLTEQILRNHHRDSRRPIADKQLIADLLPTTIDYRWNVSNKLAANFYRNNGVTEIQPAFEVKPPSVKHVMTCKYCIRYALNACKKEHKPNPALWKEPLILKTANGNTFQLEFNCKQCEMNIYAQ